MKITQTPRSEPVSRTSSVRRAEGAGTSGPSAAAVPVSTPGDILGIPRDELTPRVQEALVTLMSEVEALRKELRQAHLRIEELARLADTDSLSSIANRRAFVRELARVLSYAERYGVPTSLLFFDLNGLKEVNDTLGHRAGDAALMHVADILARNIRASDVVGRLGGDEFAVVLPHADEAQARVKAGHLAELIVSSPVRFEGREFSIDSAVGVYAFKPGETPSQVIERADAEMYRVKKAQKERKAKGAS